VLIFLKKEKNFRTCSQHRFLCLLAFLNALHTCKLLFYKKDNYVLINNPPNFLLMIKLLNKKIIISALFCFQGIAMLTAQTSEQTINGNLTNDARVKEFSMEPVKGTPSLIKMNAVGTTLSLSGTPAFLQSVLGLEATTTFEATRTTNTAQGIKITVFQQYNNGIKVEHGVFKAISKKDIVQAFTAEYYNLASISATPTLSESAALQKAFDFVGATSYAWDYVLTLGDSPEHVAAYNELYPKGELVMVDDYGTTEIDIYLAYKFNVYAAEPLSRADIYVDATNGKILLNDAIIKHADANGKNKIAKTIRPNKNTYSGNANGPLRTLVAVPKDLQAIGDTRYAGRRNFDTTLNENGFYELKGTTPTGIPNETFSFEGQGGIPLNVDLTALSESIFDGDSGLLEVQETADNEWNAEEHRKDTFDGPANNYPANNEAKNDDVALDAHWGAEIVLRYWSEIHNRESYDNNGTGVKNYVHYGDAYDNAFWNGKAMTYGDGSYQGGTNPDGSFAPLTSLDVCGHEIGHGVCEFTADLVYAKESGAMNEGFSDIWAAAVENFVLVGIDPTLPYIPWGVGEQIDERDGGLAPGEEGSRALRWMDDPKAANDPDCYDGDNWVPVTGPNCVTPSPGNDQCGVHSNSGVLNKWYYLMVEGSGQVISGGLNKVSADDEMTDAGNAYKVEPIGFDKADQITYLAETTLTPNATFLNMRDASILTTQLLYGVASYEEIQVTNAWYAVDIGAIYEAGEPDTILLSKSNVQVFTETNEIDGCSEVNAYNIVLIGSTVTEAVTIALNFGGTATKGVDYTVSADALTFPEGNSAQTVTINVVDDATIEDEAETIIMSYSFKGVDYEQTYAIGDDDFVPNTGSTPITLLEESFEGNDIPASWEIVDFSEGGPVGANRWNYNGVGTEAGRAYITNPTLYIGSATYETNSPTNVILRSPLLNGAGKRGVTVSFDWEAGGELDPADSSIIFDYGELVYSIDGKTYVGLEKFVGGGPAGAVTTSGSYSSLISTADGLPFYIGWRWYNDTNAGSDFSFAIDNVVISATPPGIETEAFIPKVEKSVKSSTVSATDAVYFLSKEDDGLMAYISNASADLGCVSIKVTEEGTGIAGFENMDSKRAEKVLFIDVENKEATYDLTLYYTNEELAEFDDASALRIILVESEFIIDADFEQKNYQSNGSAAALDVEGQFIAYTGTFKGSGPLTVSEAPASGGSLSVDAISALENSTKVYPNPAFSSLTIQLADATVKSVAIYNTLGQAIKVVNMKTANKQANLNVASLAKGFYILKISTENGTVLTKRFVKK
jgi:Zn-dependent metalloprotease